VSEPKMMHDDDVNWEIPKRVLSRSCEARTRCGERDDTRLPPSLCLRSNTLQLHSKSSYHFIMADTVQPDAKKRKMDAEHDVLAPTSSLLIKRLSEKARLPTRGSALAAGYDLYRYAHNYDTRSQIKLNIRL
jgi:hypothetical protein